MGLARMELLYLSRRDVEAVNLPMSIIIDIIEQTFKQKALGRVEMPPKPGIHPKEDAFIHAMPAYLVEPRSAGLKWVSGFPDNTKQGLPYINGLMILNDPETGLPISVMDCTWITAKRTGAATAVAAKYLARRDARIFGILGCGVQGRSNLEAISHICKDLEEVRAYDISKENLARYVSEMQNKYALKIIPVNSPKLAVEDSDIIVTAGPILKHPSPVIEPEWFKAGAFACPLDFDSYWKGEAIKSANKCCTDDLQQFNYYRSIGYFKEVPSIYAELSEIVTGKKTGRVYPDERIISINLGVAMNDLITAVHIYKRAVKLGIGRWLPL
jgi:ornithine cyclodeaminase/alanine dehydrogenase